MAVVLMFPFVGKGTVDKGLKIEGIIRRRITDGFNQEVFEIRMKKVWNFRLPKENQSYFTSLRMTEAL